MQIYDIVTYPDDRLNTPCDKVTQFGTNELREIVQRMHATIKHKKSLGFGLAANQVSIMLQIIVINTMSNNKKAQGYLGALINPEIIEYTGGIEMGNEGCLSFPKDRYDVARSTKVKVRFHDIDGNEIIRNFSGLNAVVVQHEVDHINGLTMADRANGL
jgi:peptide deformylase